MGGDRGVWWRKLGSRIRQESLLGLLLHLHPSLSPDPRVHSPELEVSSSTKVRGQLLDEGKEHRLGEWAGWLPKNLPWVHSFTHIQHQVQVSSCQSLGREW